MPCKTVLISKSIKYAGYQSIVSKKEILMEAALQPDTNVTVAFTPDGKIVGFDFGVPPFWGQLLLYFLKRRELMTGNNILLLRK